jgi:hypothetical protein
LLLQCQHRCQQQTRLLLLLLLCHIKSSAILCSWRPHTCSECVAGYVPPHLASHLPQHPPCPLHSLLLLPPPLVLQGRQQQQTPLLLLLLVLLNKTPLYWRVTSLLWVLLLLLLWWLDRQSLASRPRPADRFASSTPRGQCK